MINLERAQAYLMKELPPFRLKPLPNNEPYWSYSSYFII
jgi:hypothetical protein